MTLLPSKTSTFTALASLLVFADPLTASAAKRSITEFKKEDNQKLDWRVVDVGVMGGLSEGKLTFTKNNTLRFSGNLSLENNGGFSSLRTKDIKLDLGKSDGLEMRVKGDGRTFGVRIGSDARFRGMEVSFGATFPTKKGKWTTVRVPFSKLRGGWRGRDLKDAAFNPSKIQRLGIIIADKKTGPFDLEVEWIHAYSGKGKGEKAKPKNVIKTALADGRFKTLAKALTEAGLVDALQGDGPFTVFAPTDNAFAALPEDTVATLLKRENREQLQAVLKYHVIAGSIPLADALKAREAKTLQGQTLSIAFADGRVRINESPLLDADIACTNGVIHVVESVILPPAPEATTDILGVAKSAKVFGTLLAAVEAAGLTETLAGDGPFTVFAPTDEAFAKLPKGTVESLLKKENLDKLQAILTYHAVSGKVSAGDALNAKSAKTVNGKALEFRLEGGVLQVNGATIRKADIACDNGVIHIIDAVLLPPAPEKEKKTKNAKEAKGTQKRIDPLALIEDAIDRGVPTYNQGHHAECAEIYKKCLETLTDGKHLEAETQTILNKVLEMSAKLEDADDRAWLFRRGLDHAYHAMSE